MTVRLEVPALSGLLVRLEPLSPAHQAALLVAASEDRTTYDFTWVPREDDEMEDYLRFHLGERDAGGHFPMAIVRLGDDRVVGHTALFNLRFLPRAEFPFAAEIGHTWLAASAQRSGVNVNAKLLLCEHAFESWGVERVDLKTDARNARSRAAIAGLGAQLEGVLRNFGRSWAPGESGRTRDSAMFSITSGEWPEVKSALAGRLTAFRRGASESGR